MVNEGNDVPHRMSNENNVQQKMSDKNNVQQIKYSTHRMSNTWSQHITIKWFPLLKRLGCDVIV